MNRILIVCLRIAAGMLLTTATPCFAASFSGSLIVNIYAPANGGDFAGGPTLSIPAVDFSGFAGAAAVPPSANQQATFTSVDLGPIAGWAGAVEGGGEAHVFTMAQGPSFSVYNPHDVFASIFVPFDYTYVIHADPGDAGDSAKVKVEFALRYYGGQRIIREEVTTGTLACLICTGVLSVIAPPHSNTSIGVEWAFLRAEAISDGIQLVREVPGPSRTDTPEPGTALLALAGLGLVALGKFGVRIG